MNEQRQADLLKPTCSNSVPIRDVALEDLLEAIDDREGSEISVLIAQHDDDNARLTKPNLSNCLTI